jgi:transcriptional regulator with XRE-family HTH domain
MKMVARAMTLREKIIYLLDMGYSQTQISEKTTITQSSVSKILNGKQNNILHSKGVLLDALIKPTKKPQAA